MRKAFRITAAGFVLLVVYVVLRAALLETRQLSPSPMEPVAINRDRSVKHLSEAIGIPTISYRDPARIDAHAFLGFHKFLAQSFPRVHAALAKEAVGSHSLLYVWKGEQNRSRPILLIGHMDVVPVDPKTEADWSHAPFSGRVIDGYIWGRGTMDDKVSVLGILEAVEHLLEAGFRPRRTIFFAFGHDEEVGGRNGAAKIAELLRSRGVRFEFVLDEGGFIVEGLVPGIRTPTALVGIAEKGYMSVELTAESQGGHSSTPPAQTAIGILAAAIHKLDQNPFPADLRGATRQMFEFIGPEASWLPRVVLANLWLFGGLVQREMAGSPPTDAMIRTSHAATIFESGVKDNVLPAKARAVVNFRLLTGDTPAAVLARVENVIGDPRVTVTPLEPMLEPSPISAVDSAAFRLIRRTIRQISGDTVVAPSLLVAATDSRHYSALSDNLYRFIPLTLGAGDAARFHGMDERISVRDYERCIRFYIQLIRNSAS